MPWDIGSDYGSVSPERERDKNDNLGKTTARRYLLNQKLSLLKGKWKQRVHESESKFLLLRVPLPALWVDLKKEMFALLA